MVMIFVCVSSNKRWSTDALMLSQEFANELFSTSQSLSDSHTRRYSYFTEQERKQGRWEDTYLFQDCNHSSKEREA